MRVRAIGLGCAAALAACAPTPRSAPTASTVSGGPVCRVGPDGGPLSAERGIGGTGAPPTQIAERGIGGTGIIGVVTGFASICLAGHEVALPADVPVEIAGVAADQQALRAGQVAAVEAGGPADALYARRIAIRYEVQGPIEAIAGDRLQVAGQTVLLSRDTWLRTPPALGQWVAVSGLRDASGAIAATRMDLVSIRTFIVHGVVQAADGGYRIGTLPVIPGPGDVLVPGLPVSITGVYGDGVLRARTIAPDLLASDPVAYFGSYTSNFILEGWGGTLPFLQAPATSRPIGGGRGVMEFQRAGGTQAGRLQPAPGGAARTFEPAPTPNRALGYGGAADRAGPGSRFGGNGRGQGFRPQAGGGENQPGRGLEGPGGRRR